VRSIRGAEGRWFRGARDGAEPALLLDGQRLPVRAIPVADAAELERVTEAYRQKYGHSPWLKSVVTPESVATTLRLEPR
jgi:hypothetical protein